MQKNSQGPRPKRVVIVTRQTELDELVARFTTVPQVRFYLDHAGQDFAPIQRAHDVYVSGLETLRKSVPAELKVHTVDRSLVPQYTFARTDLVVAIGQDGLVSNTAKYLSGQPLIGVNPNPNIYDGVLLPFGPRTAHRAFSACLCGHSETRHVTLGEVNSSDGQQLLAFNDFFIGAKSHVSARYEIAWNERREVQSSSGIIVSTGAGSTGWLSSVYRGAANLLGEVSEVGQPSIVPEPIPWDTNELVFVVREPFPSSATRCDLVYGRPRAQAPLVVRSHMPTGGVVFSDGMEDDFITFNTGAEITVSVATKYATLIVDGGR